MIISGWAIGCIAGGLSLAVLAVVPAPAVEQGPGSFRVMSYASDYGPPSGLVEVSPGVFYSNGGTSSQLIFSITDRGVSSIVATLPAGHYIQSPLVSASNGLLYSSIAHKSDPVTVFSVGMAAGALKLYTPQDIDPMPAQNLPDGSLLGIAVTLSGDRTYSLIKCGLDGKITTLHRFPSGESLPHTAIYGSDGNSYGVSVLADGSGYVYRVTASGELSKLTTFPAQSFHGSPAFVPLLQAADGNLYGTTTNGGEQGAGTIYKLTLDGRYTLLHSFARKRVSFSPVALIEASDGNLYGATLGVESQLFRVTTSGQFTLLYTMNMYTDARCPCQLIQASDGKIYGSAMLGGTAGLGAIFTWNAGLPKPKPSAPHFQPEAGAAGAGITIWGTNLLSAAVSFNGVPAAQVSGSGPNYVRAVVPPGATSGPISITTPGGSVKTSAPFSVLTRP